MERLGGLIHRMPKTAVVFLIGCAAISALPPLNGFVSEWLTFQAILVEPAAAAMGPALHDPGGRRAARAVGGARRRLLRQGLRRRLPRPAAHAGGRRARRRSTASRSPPCSSSRRCASSPACCPGSFIDMLAPVVQSLVGARMPAQTFLPWPRSCRSRESRSSYNGLLILLFLVVSGTLDGDVHSSLRHPRHAAERHLGLRLSRSDAPPTQYTGSSFAMPIRRVFGTTVFGVREQVDMPRPGETRAGAFPRQGARSGLALCLRPARRAA